jgi:prophage antirepressor-like protein
MAATFDLGSRLLRLGDASARVHIRTVDGQPQPWFQAKPIVVHLGYSPSIVSQTLSKLPEKHRKNLGELTEGDLLNKPSIGHNECITIYLSEASFSSCSAL